MAYKEIIQIISIFGVFAVIHSVCVTESVKKIMAKLLGRAFMQASYRFLFTCLSVITLFIAIALIKRIPDRNLIDLPMWPAAFFYLLQLTGLVVGILSFKIINIFEFLGLSQLVSYVRQGIVSGDIEGISENRLITDGIYGIVRHPLYLAGLLLFTFNPYLTRTMLTITVAADCYFIAGAVIEDRRLCGKFGDEYAQYMKTVPRLIPNLRRIVQK